MSSYHLSSTSVKKSFQLTDKGLVEEDTVMAWNLWVSENNVAFLVKSESVFLDSVDSLKAVFASGALEYN